MNFNGYGTVYFSRMNDLKDGTIGKRLTYVKPTFFLGVPRVWEKIAEKMQAVGRSTKGLKKMIATWAKGKALKRSMRMQLAQDPDNAGTAVRTPFMMGLADVLLNKIKMALGLEHCKLAITCCTHHRGDPRVFRFAWDLHQRSVRDVGELRSDELEHALLALVGKLRVPSDGVRGQVLQG
jgi:hypothetical protein